MLSRLLTAVATAATLVTAIPAVAQSPADDSRFRAAQDRFDREYRIFQQETQRYQAVRGRGGYSAPQGYPQGYNGAPPPVAYQQNGYSEQDDRYDPNYDPARYYRAGSSETVLSTNDRVYAGNDGRYYCRRSDGTTGLIIGAAGGGVLGNVIAGGHSRTLGTLLGAAGGALVGRAVDQNNSQVRCR